MNKIIIFMFFFEIYILKIIKNFNELSINNINDLNGIYVINIISNKLYLSIEKNKLVMRNKKIHFRLILIKSNIYYIEIRGTKRRIGVDNNNNLKLYNTKNNIIRNKLFWKIIRISDMEFFIQNKFNLHKLKGRII